MRNSVIERSRMASTSTTWPRGKWNRSCNLKSWQVPHVEIQKNPGKNPGNRRRFLTDWIATFFAGFFCGSPQMTLINPNRFRLNYCWLELNWCYATDQWIPMISVARVIRTLIARMSCRLNRDGFSVACNVPSESSWNEFHRCWAASIELNGSWILQVQLKLATYHFSADRNYVLYSFDNRQVIIQFESLIESD